MSNPQAPHTPPTNKAQLSSKQGPSGRGEPAPGVLQGSGGRRGGRRNIRSSVINALVVSLFMCYLCLFLSSVQHLCVFDSCMFKIHYQKEWVIQRVWRPKLQTSSPEIVSKAAGVREGSSRTICSSCLGGSPERGCYLGGRRSPGAKRRLAPLGQPRFHRVLLPPCGQRGGLAQRFPGGDTEGRNGEADKEP